MLPTMGSFETRLRWRIRLDYGLVGLLIGLFPLFITVPSKIFWHHHIFINSLDEDTISKLGFFEWVEWLRVSTTNAIVIGCVVLIVLRLFGPFLTPIFLAAFYPLCVWFTMNPWGHYLFYTPYGHKPTYPFSPLWPAIALALVVLTWTLMGSKQPFNVFSKVTNRLHLGEK